MLPCILLLITPFYSLKAQKSIDISLFMQPTHFVAEEIELLLLPIRFSVATPNMG